MDSIRNLNGYVSPSSAQNGSPLKLRGVSPANLEKISPIEAISSKRSLKQYAEIAQENHSNKQSFIKQDNLRYSTSSALNQYTNNANFEHTEKTNAMLGLSVYA